MCVFRLAGCLQTTMNKSVLQRCRWFGCSASCTQKGEKTLDTKKISLLSSPNRLAAPASSDHGTPVAKCSSCPTSIVPIPSSNEEIRLVDDAFGKISHMVSDGSWMVRVQAAKTLVRKQTNTRSIHLVSHINSSAACCLEGHVVSDHLFCVRVRCCRSVLTFWSKLWIRS